MKVKNKLIAILLSASLVISLMPALAFASAGDEDDTYGAVINAEQVEESQLAEPERDSLDKQEVALEIESNAIEAKGSEWQQIGSGTQYYAEFPSGYNTSSSLYSKYNRSKLTSYENTTNKRVVNTTRVSYIYWHWTWNASVSTEQNNKLIDDKRGNDGQHDYQYFTDFESSEEYPVWSGDSRVYEYWRNRPEDGSKWWFRIPVYKQTYTDYKLTQSGGTSPATNPSSTGNPSTASGGNPVTTKAPKAVSLGKCKSGKRQCTVKWKKNKKCIGYIVRYSTDPNFTVCRTKVIKGRNKTSCTLKKLTGGAVYYIQVCCYRKSGGTRICSAWSKCKKVKIKAAKSKKTKKKAKKAKTKQGKYGVISKYNKKTGAENYYLVKYSGKKKKVLKKLPKDADDGLGFWDYVTVKGRYIFLARGDGVKWRLYTYRYDLKKKKLKKIATDLAPILLAYNPYNSGDYYLCNHWFDTAGLIASKLSLCKLTSSGKIEVVKGLGDCTDAGFAGGHLYYARFSGLSAARYEDYINVTIQINVCNVDGSGERQIGSFTKRYESGTILHAGSFTNANCLIYIGEDTYIFDYASGSLSYR